MSKRKNILIYGYGNPGRQDDGLGKAMIDIATRWADEQKLENLTFEAGFQLQVEDILMMRDKDLVIFVDASMEETVDTFWFEKIRPDNAVTFTMHAVSPGFILSLYTKMYGTPPPSYLMHIRGYEWELSETLSPKAESNLKKAWKELKKLLLHPHLAEEQQEKT